MVSNPVGAMSTEVLRDQGKIMTFWAGQRGLGPNNIYSKIVH